MSRIKELRLHGFKTFADPTHFVFQPGVNAVIGPNGSGKSNMADAVRWVLGEQSNRFLRTRRAEDVIFAGSQERRPHGMAEAILTLDNSDGWLPIDFAEVTVGRRSYRSGDSEYLINGAKARLRDVVELLGEGRLGANELVVVGQGTVDAALSLRPEERRQLFEEAAGVKGLQVRKNEALARLAKARDNLTRVTDLVGELKPQVRRLAQQAQHQQQHDELLGRARGLLGEAHRRREQAARSALGEARRRAAAAETALETHRAEQEAGREALATAETGYWDAEATARVKAELRESTREGVIRAESRVEAVAARRSELVAAVEQGEGDLRATQAALAALAVGAVEATIAPAVRAAAEAEERWRTSIDELAAADVELLVAEEALAEARQRESAAVAAAARRGEELARAAARRAQIERELAAASAAEREAADLVDPARKGLAEAEATLARARAALTEAEATRDVAQPRADAARQRAAELAERVGALRAELQALRERAEHGARLGSLLAAAGWPALLDSIDAPQEAWAAIEAVVGGELEHALLWRDGEVTDRLAEARGAARLLTAAHGPAGDRPAALAAVGAQRTLADWVGAAHAPALFHRTAVAIDVGSLLAGWRNLPAGWCAVTPQGDLADSRGVVVLRGRSDQPGGASARRHARRRELSEMLERLDAEQAAAGAAAAQALAALSETHRTLDAAREQLAESERRERAARAESDAATEHATRSRAALEALVAELASLDNGLNMGDAPQPGEPMRSPDLVRLEDRAAAARQRRAAAAETRDRERERWQETRAAAEQAEHGTAGRRREQAMLEARQAQLEAALPAQRRAMTALAADHEAAMVVLEAARREDHAAAEARAAAEAERERQRRELLELERGSGGAAARLAELERTAQAAAIEASRLDEALASLAREREVALESLADAALEEGGAQQPSAELAAALAALDEEALEAEQRRVRRMLGQIGSVNPFAVEEHRELAARLEELTTQDQDLRDAIGSTEELIQRLEAEIGEKFGAAFAAIGERFDEYCRLLFAGGSGSLTLGDGGDGDAPGGIEIVVRPPGKRLQRLAMLSGGERALTGVALLFAMLSVNPVPFCILDEVDAALDEANIGRFAEALRRLADEIDFVVITHNRATIEVADTIYGVTMTDAAVSRVLSLRLSDLPAEVPA